MKADIKKSIIGISIGILIFSIGFILAYSSFNASSKNSNCSRASYEKQKYKNDDELIKETVAINLESELSMNYKQDSDLKDFIHGVHEKLNLSVGWDKTPTSKEYRELAQLADEVNKIEKNILNVSLANDLKNLENYLRDGGKDENKNSIIKAHRIAHDLDYHFFNDNDEVMFDVTETLSKNNK